MASDLTTLSLYLFIYLFIYLIVKTTAVLWRRLSRGLVALLWVLDIPLLPVLYFSSCDILFHLISQILRCLISLKVLVWESKPFKRNSPNHGYLDLKIYIVGLLFPSAYFFAVIQRALT